MQSDETAAAYQVQWIGGQHSGAAGGGAREQVPDWRRRRRAGSPRRQAVDQCLAVPLVGAEVDGGIRHDARNARTVAPAVGSKATSARSPLVGSGPKVLRGTALTRMGAPRGARRLVTRCMETLIHGKAVS